MTLYGIRHRFGTQSIINGVDIKTLAELTKADSPAVAPVPCRRGRFVFWVDPRLNEKP